MTSLMGQIAKLRPEYIQHLHDELTDEQALTLLYDWDLWARDKQKEPPGNWTIWLLMAGRGFGKSKTGAEWIRGKVEKNIYGRIALVGRTAADVRDVMIEGESGILACSPPWFRPTYQPSRRRLVWPNGAMAITYSADSPEMLRGPQHDAFWADEIGAWAYIDAWDQLMFGLRLGKRPRGVATTTPRPTALIKRLIKDSNVHVTTGTTFENLANLAPTFMRQVVGRYKDTRLGLQELYAQLLEDRAGALWTRDLLERTRVHEVPDLSRIVVGVDPSVSDPSEMEESSENHAETGIVGVGIAPNGHAYVLEDASMQGSPFEWAHQVVSVFNKLRGDRIVAEKNNGGVLVKSNIRAINKQVPIRLVWAARGKYTRAEPIANFYEQNLVHHVGLHGMLEDQQCQWVPGEKSPDRLDACVWGLTELLIHEENNGIVTNIEGDEEEGNEPLSAAVQSLQIQSTTQPNSILWVPSQVEETPWW